MRLPIYLATATGTRSSKTRSRRCGLRGQAGAGLCDVGIQYLVRLSPVPRGCHAGARNTRTGGPEFDKIRVFYNHPGFIEPMIELTEEALGKIPPERRAAAEIVFTAHSVPVEMARHSDYVVQLNEAARLIAEGVRTSRYRVAYQSRSGSPRIPWLEPDILDELTAMHGEGVTDVVIVPVGFISDHMEVLFDLDHEANEHAAELGMTMVRAATVGTHPRFVAMIRELIVERMSERPERLALGRRGPNHDICPIDCCLLHAPSRPGAPTRPY